VRVPTCVYLRIHQRYIHCVFAGVCTDGSRQTACSKLGLLDVNGLRICVRSCLNVDLYGCETWSVTLREEHRLRVFENRVLRGIFGTKRDGVTGEWRRLHNEELDDLYCLASVPQVGRARRKCVPS
jgi:hypothetical protein